MAGPQSKISGPGQSLFSRESALGIAEIDAVSKYSSEGAHRPLGRRKGALVSAPERRGERGHENEPSPAQSGMSSTESNNFFLSLACISSISSITPMSFSCISPLRLKSKHFGCLPYFTAYGVTT